MTRTFHVIHVRIPQRYYQEVAYSVFPLLPRHQAPSKLTLKPCRVRSRRVASSISEYAKRRRLVIRDMAQIAAERLWGLGWGGEGGRVYATMETDGLPTATSQQQIECERTCELSFLPLRPDALDEEDMEDFRRNGIISEAGEPLLMRDKHEAYLRRGLLGLSQGFISLDASRPWMMYWILHSLDLLERLPEKKLLDRVVDTIGRCEDKVNGGFAGGPQQLPHGAPMYAAVLSLLLIGTPEAYAVIDRRALYRFFVSLKHESGGFRMHDDGEVDVRGTYTVIAIASLLNILTPELSRGVADFADGPGEPVESIQDHLSTSKVSFLLCLLAYVAQLRCQTYEGGFGGEPWNEAHGGYTFCAFASLVILGESQRADLEALGRWLCGRQMRAEGGFQGRTNKLVDGCYSFWQGGALALLDYVSLGKEADVSHRDRNGRFIRAHAREGGGDHRLFGVSRQAQSSSDGLSSSQLSVTETTSGGAGRQASGDADGRRDTCKGNVARDTDGGVMGSREKGMQSKEAEVVRGQEGVSKIVEAELDLAQGSDAADAGAGSGLAAGGEDLLTFSREALQEYVLMCSQQPEGGLRDKPGKSRDFYHTCYTLSGLSIAQHCLADRPVITGDPFNELRRTNAAFNIAEDKVLRAMAHFDGMPSTHADLMARPS